MMRGRQEKSRKRGRAEGRKDRRGIKEKGNEQNAYG